MDYIERIDLLNENSQYNFYMYSMEAIGLNESFNIGDKIKNLVKMFKEALSKLAKAFKDLLAKIFNKSKIQDKVIDNQNKELKDIDPENVDEEAVASGFNNVNSQSDNNSTTTSDNTEKPKDDKPKYSTYTSDSLVNISIKTINKQLVEDTDNFMSHTKYTIELEMDIYNTIIKDPTNYIEYGKNGEYIKNKTDQYKLKYENFKKETEGKGIFNDKKVKLNKFYQNVLDTIKSQLSIIKYAETDMKKYINDFNKTLEKFEKDVNVTDIEKLVYQYQEDSIKNMPTGMSYADAKKWKKSHEVQSSTEVNKKLVYMTDLFKSIISIAKNASEYCNKICSEIIRAKSLYIAYNNVVLRARKRNGRE